jgi:tRNA pseudouridine13 synthase
MRLMYLHAYQSYIWNMATSKRIELYGLEPTVGDIAKKHTDYEANQIVKLTDENIREYEMADVVLPLPGYSIMLPDNKCKRLYLKYIFTLTAY